MLVATLGEVLILAWFFVTGSVLGSFLNVVIYRVPRGLSLVHPPSRCPVCLHPIRWYDNIPIFGWFLLRGRCRDCGARIAKRYPVVEALAGLDVLLIALRNGNWRWVPVLDSLLQEGIIQPGVIETAVSVGVSLSLLAAAIILYDGARVPLSFWTVAIVLVLIGHMAVTRTINHGENPPYGPPLGRTAAVPPRLPAESRAEAPFQSTFGKTKDR
ncbi:MAG: prepilin peptidase, partial [Thermogutta sp.]|nr:prepilin peptidase [Thermogutta sp.]